MTALSLILPCLNEAERLPATLATYLAQLPSAPAASEVPVVDDGSTDATAEEPLVFTDADGAYWPGEQERVLQALETAPVAIGTRGPDGGAPLARQVASRAFNHALHLLSDLPFTDTQCGLKAVRRHAAHQLFGRARVNGFAFDSVRRELGPGHPSGEQAYAR
jgi:dolichyl-phosphate beta-glucosyltransferase